MGGDKLRIGELSRRVNLSVGWLRHLADTNAIPSIRSPGGHRLFDLDLVRDALARRQRGGAAQLLEPLQVEPPEPPSWSGRSPLEGLQEDQVWQTLCSELDLDRSTPAGKVMTYAFTEMLNNAIDHSGGTQATVAFWVSPDRWAFRIVDDGEGVFPHLRVGLGLSDDFAAVQELTKGKRTTWAERHSGEGIFFTSKMVDLFRLSSAGLRWTVDNIRGDHAAGRSEPVPGTTVYAEVSPATTRLPGEVFAQFTEAYEFVRTRPVVKLFGMGLTFVSRSEARRLLEGLETFTEIEVDFAGVDDVGQGFVDEMFRVWPASHPDQKVIPTKMNEAVDFMVRRGLARRADLDAKRDDGRRR